MSMTLGMGTPGHHSQLECVVWCSMWLAVPCSLVLLLPRYRYVLRSQPPGPDEWDMPLFREKVMHGFKLFLDVLSTLEVRVMSFMLHHQLQHRPCLHCVILLISHPPIPYLECSHVTCVLPSHIRTVISLTFVLSSHSVHELW